MAQQAIVVILDEWRGDYPLDPREIYIDRHSLAKRRWRVVAESQQEIAYGLEVPTKHHSFLLGDDNCCYQVIQKEEEVIAIPIPKAFDMSVKLGWYLGNQHLAIEVREDEILLENVHTLVKSLDRIGIPYQQRDDVFLCALHSSHNSHG